MKTQLSLVAALLAAASVSGADLKIGIIGCDTSHATAFTDTLNNATNKNHVPGGKVVAAFKGGSPDVKESASRIDGYTKILQEKYGVTMYDSIEELCKNVDVVLLESIDGRPHLEQVKPVFKAGKPVFIDKPMAASLKDVVEIFRLAKESNVPVFSSSSLRFAKATQAVHNGSIGTVTNAETYGPCELEPHHPDLFWYGVHGTEALFTVMGTGCETVQRGTNASGKIMVTGMWPGGRKGVFQEDKNFHGVAKGEKGQAPVGTFDLYPPLLVAIMEFFKTGVAPVKPQETVEIIAFMEAADLSKQRGGAPVKLSEVIQQSGWKQ